MIAALRILFNVALYRLRRLEMANMGGALLIMLALRLSPLDVVVRLGFAFLLNLLVYLNNDYLDLPTDLRSPERDDANTRYLRDHRRAALGAQLGLVGALLVVAFAWDLGLLIPLVVGGGVCWLYSARLKHVAGADIAAMMVWGAAMLTVAFPPTHALGWALAGLLALDSAVFETIQVIRDHDADRDTGVRTTAVALGVPRTLALARGLLVLGAGAAALAIHPLVALPPLIGVTLPLGRPERYWNLIRVLLGVAFLFAAGWVYVHGATAGLLVRCALDGCTASPGLSAMSQ
ncbi:UbiA family prenyltransferase [Nannocystis bainbridge]|uniref:UbiA family prenyltransferase n=1 Tax=Nannocystis bainbridge TaxID=2995303 RepID=A0ABT5EA01_9BACT|nr:UbiA family prenyltransferase [Nannocystis bainbridge]MDC0722184.1 UbiA family prenyltransferase [Nannocystis bainbridge]